MSLNRKLYVGNIPYQTTEDDLTRLFTAVGTVEQVTVMREPETGRARGFAFVRMASIEGAQAAIERFDQSTLLGRTLTVNMARPKPDAPSSSHHHGSRDQRRGHARREARW